MSTKQGTMYLEISLKWPDLKFGQKYKLSDTTQPCQQDRSEHRVSKNDVGTAWPPLNSQICHSKMNGPNLRRNGYWLPTTHHARSGGHTSSWQQPLWSANRRGPLAIQCCFRWGYCVHWTPAGRGAPCNWGQVGHDRWAPTPKSAFVVRKPKYQPWAEVRSVPNL